MKNKHIRFGTDSIPVEGETDTEIIQLHNGNMIIYQTTISYYADGKNVAENIIFLRPWEVEKLVDMVEEHKEATT